MASPSRLLRVLHQTGQSFNLGLVRFLPGGRCLISRSLRFLTYKMWWYDVPFRIFIGKERKKGACKNW